MVARYLKPELFSFDSSKTPVSQYLDRVEHFRHVKGDSLVLEAITTGILLKSESDGAKWYESLSALEKHRMDEDLDLWDTKMRERFQKDRGECMRQADELRHHFGDELDVHDYIDKKIRLYREAGNVDEDQIVRRVYHQFDPILHDMITLNRDTNTLLELNTKVSEKLSSAEAKWKREEEKWRHVDEKINAKCEDSRQDSRKSWNIASPRKDKNNRVDRSYRSSQERRSDVQRDRDGAGRWNPQRDDPNQRWNFRRDNRDAQREGSSRWNALRRDTADRWDKDKRQSRYPDVSDDARKKIWDVVKADLHDKPSLTDTKDGKSIVKTYVAEPDVPSDIDENHLKHILSYDSDFNPDGDESFTAPSNTGSEN
jgi:hypothetical protein